MNKHVDKPVWSEIADRRLELGPKAEPEKATRHWRLTRDDENIAWLVLDRADERANTISSEVLRELDEMVRAVEAAPPKALLVRSAKESGFAAGADIREFGSVADAGEAAAKLGEAHDVLDRIAALQMPTIAVLHGVCLGGGLELALAFDLRIAVSGARLGTPEVMLGLHPGAGGTHRLTTLIDPTEGMKLMLTGKPASAEKARRLGLVDAVVDERHVAAAVRAAASGELKAEGRGWRASAMGTRPARGFAARKMREEAAKRAPPEHYPAPYRLIDLWEAHGGDRRAMRDGEIASFAELITGDTAQNLIRVFFLRERMKGLGKGDGRSVRHVHVVGAGTMGGDIAAWCALKGLRASVTDLDPETIAKAMGRANALFEDKAEDSRALRDARDRLIPDFAGDGVAQADLVIEAVVEKADVKGKVYAGLEPRMKEGAVLATNTSSIPLEVLRDKLERPERLVGLHFFNPVAKMQLVEVVSHDRADEGALALARGLCGAIDRLPAPVASAPGFLVNRVLTPYLAEALALIDAGVKPEAIDRAATKFGMAMGPVEVADRVGLDICLEVLDMLRDRLGGDMPDAPGWLRDKVEKGDLGRKSGQGLYAWKDGDAQKAEAKDAAKDEPDPEMVDRLILPMVNTAAACLRDGVVEDADLIDGAMIFATGFAPFRGGPAKYARDRGIDAVRDRLKDLADRHGARFRPDDGLDRLKEET